MQTSFAKTLISRLGSYLAASAFCCSALACRVASLATSRSDSRAASVAAASFFAASVLACTGSHDQTHFIPDIILKPPCICSSFTFCINKSGGRTESVCCRDVLAPRVYLSSSRLALLDKGAHRGRPCAGGPLPKRVQLLRICAGCRQPPGSLLLHRPWTRLAVSVSDVLPWSFTMQSGRSG